MDKLGVVLHTWKYLSVTRYTVTLNIFSEKCEKSLINRASDILPVHAKEDTSKCRQKYRMLKEQIGVSRRDNSVLFYAWNVPKCHCRYHSWATSCIVLYELNPHRTLTAHHSSVFEVLIYQKTGLQYKKPELSYRLVLKSQ